MVCIKKMHNDKLNKINFLFTTFTTLCFSPIWTILLRDLARTGGYSIRLYNYDILYYKKKFKKIQLRK